MMRTWLLVFAGLLAGGMVAVAIARRGRRPLLTLRAVVGGLLGVNGLVAAGCALLVAIYLAAPPPVLAQAAAPAAGTSSNVALGAALATGLACIGAGIAVGIAGAAAIGGITEKPEILGRTLIFVGLAEGIAIYGLIVSFIILRS
ncbi:MAG: ATPase [Chloroflexi bacterium]|jgi:V/A-type H+-transporting ATPase subunit K|nr:ATPase [Chloroflexota bacterium]